MEMEKFILGRENGGRESLVVGKGKEEGGVGVRRMDDVGRVGDLGVDLEVMGF